MKRNRVKKESKGKIDNGMEFENMNTGRMKKLMDMRYVNNEQTHKEIKRRNLI